MSQHRPAVADLLMALPSQRAATSLNTPLLLPANSRGNMPLDAASFNQQRAATSLNTPLLPANSRGNMPLDAASFNSAFCRIIRSHLRSHQVRTNTHPEPEPAEPGPARVPTSPPLQPEPELAPGPTSPSQPERLPEPVPVISFFVAITLVAIAFYDGCIWWWRLLCDVLRYVSPAPEPPRAVATPCSSDACVAAAERTRDASLQALLATAPIVVPRTRHMLYPPDEPHPVLSTSTTRTAEHRQRAGRRGRRGGRRVQRRRGHFQDRCAAADKSCVAHREPISNTISIPPAFFDLRDDIYELDRGFLGLPPYSD